MITLYSPIYIHCINLFYLREFKNNEIHFILLIFMHKNILYSGKKLRGIVPFKKDVYKTKDIGNQKKVILNILYYCLYVLFIVNTYQSLTAAVVLIHLHLFTRNYFNVKF